MIARRPPNFVSPTVAALLLACLSLAGTGCRSKPAQTLDADVLTLGRLDVSTLAPILGEPKSRSTFSSDAGVREVQTFRPPTKVNLIDAGVPELKMAVLETLDGKVQGFLLMGPLPSDRLTIGPHVMQEIEIGKTLESDLVRQLGPPIGRGLPDTRLFTTDQPISPRVTQRLAWVDYTHGRRGLLRHEVNLRLLLVDIDSGNRVVSTETRDWTQMMLGPRL